MHKINDLGKTGQAARETPISSGASVLSSASEGSRASGAERRSRRAVEAEASSWINNTPTRELLYGLYGKLSKDALVVIIRACIDESSTEDNSAAPMHMYCAVANDLQWQRFDKKWKKVLDKYEVPYFHAEELLGRRKNFTGWNPEKVNNFFNDLEPIITKHVKFGFCAVLEHADFHSYRTDNKNLNGLLDSKWGLCFRFCLAFLHEIVPEVLGKKPKVFVVYENCPSGGAASEILRQMQEAIPNCFIESAAPVRKEKNYGTQAADLRAAARIMAAKNQEGSYKEISSEEGVKIDLITKFTEFRIPLDKDILLELRDKRILSRPKFQRLYSDYLSGGEKKITS